MSITVTAEHNLEHNSPFWGVIPKSIILEFRNIMSQPLATSAKRSHWILHV